MNSIGYVWSDREFGHFNDRGEPWCAVAVPDPNATMWRTWLNRQDAGKRRYLADDGIWLFSPELYQEIEARFIEAGWAMNMAAPPFLQEDDILSDFQHSQNYEYTHQHHAHRVQNIFDFSAYEALQVSPYASKEVIDAAYRALIKKTHPDHGGNEDQAKELNRAKEQIYNMKGW